MASRPLSTDYTDSGYGVGEGVGLDLGRFYPEVRLYKSDAAEVEEDDTENYAKPFAVLYVELLAELIAGTLVITGPERSHKSILTTGRRIRIRAEQVQ